MRWIVANIKGIMIVAGVMTCTMLYVVIAPQTALRSTFGETLEGPLAGVIVRNWGTLIVLGGASLIYGAYHPPVRPIVLAVTGLGKLAFIALVLAQGGRFVAHQAGVAVAADLVMVALFAGYLVGARRTAP